MYREIGITIYSQYLYFVFITSRYKSFSWKFTMDTFLYDCHIYIYNLQNKFKYFV